MVMVVKRRLNSSALPPSTKDSEVVNIVAYRGNIIKLYLFFINSFIILLDIYNVIVRNNISSINIPINLFGVIRYAIRYIK